MSICFCADASCSFVGFAVLACPPLPEEPPHAAATTAQAQTTKARPPGRRERRMNMEPILLPDVAADRLRRDVSLQDVRATGSRARRRPFAASSDDAACGRPLAPQCDWSDSG